MKNPCETAQCRVLSAALAAVFVAGAGAANAGGTITFGEDKSVSVGFGMRASFKSVEDAAPNGSSRSSDFNLDSSRLFVSGSLNKYISGMFNTVFNEATYDTKVIDANVQIKFAPEYNIWVGRFLSPSDRANLAGPYYSLGGGYWAGIASRYGFNGGYVGRDDGVAIVGDLMGGKVGYSAGVFEGHTAFNITGGGLGLANSKGDGSDGLMYAGRVQVDLWDPEPGYYGTGNYLGTKDILAVGVAGRTQSGGASFAGASGTYSSYSVDFLLEKKDFGPGGVSIEAAYYDYDTDGVILAEQGKAYSAGMGYIFSEKVGWGKVQPFVRWQKFDADNSISDRKYDVGVAYIIEGYNAQISAFYGNQKTTGVGTRDSFVVATQFQF